MTKRECLDTLVRAAAERARGSGTGIASVPSEAEKSRIYQAVRRVFCEAYGFHPSDQDLANLGVPASARPKQSLLQGPGRE